MARLLFEKTGNAIWISHLDLMRLFQRAFKRAGFSLTHTQGYNPRPSVSIALPLSVGVESCCELLDFDLDCEPDCWERVPAQLNDALIPGVRVLEIYPSGRKIKELALMHSQITLVYDSGVPSGAKDSIENLLSKSALTVIKKTKNGPQEQDIIPMIRRFEIREEGDRFLKIGILHCCQNPALNPMQVLAAIQLYLPELTPDFGRCCRMEVYDSDEVIFR